MPTLKSIYESYPQPKCSYNRFWFRLKRGWEQDRAILRFNKYAPKMNRDDKLKKLNAQLDKLISMRSKYKQGTKNYSNIQERKNKIVRLISAYKSK